MRANVISGKNGVTIGENAVIGVCTLVNKDIPDNATAVGVPCRILEKTGVFLTSLFTENIVKEALVICPATIHVAEHWFHKFDKVVGRWNE